MIVEAEFFGGPQDGARTILPEGQHSVELHTRLASPIDWTGALPREPQYLAHRYDLAPPTRRRGWALLYQGVR